MAVNKQGYCPISDEELFISLVLAAISAQPRACGFLCFGCGESDDYDNLGMYILYVAVLSRSHVSSLSDRP